MFTIKILCFIASLLKIDMADNHQASSRYHSSFESQECEGCAVMNKLDTGLLNSNYPVDCQSKKNIKKNFHISSLLLFWCISHLLQPYGMNVFLCVWMFSTIFRFMNVFLCVISIFLKFSLFGDSRWSKIVQHQPGRTDTT
uniref:Uncharacterized protein n=1 Tax=Nelumbo nucifera TaxID=4432 RepID=A0A822XNM7_NELNU|nr:TPA_asm: hypothetical protein HUJ06_022264 [Nelumbo nucifera]